MSELGAAIDSYLEEMVNDQHGILKEKIAGDIRSIIQAVEAKVSPLCAPGDDCPNCNHMGALVLMQTGSAGPVVLRCTNCNWADDSFIVPKGHQAYVDYSVFQSDDKDVELKADSTMDAAAYPPPVAKYVLYTELPNRMADTEHIIAQWQPEQQRYAALARVQNRDDGNRIIDRMQEWV